jgi:hypothetical protein
METDGWLPHLQAPVICPSPETFYTGDIGKKKNK